MTLTVCRCLTALTFALAVGFVTIRMIEADEPTPSGWKLVWSDEFDGKEIDRAKWDFDLGNGFYNYDAHQWISGWGNNELQFYTREPENAFVAEGTLHIRAIRETPRRGVRPQPGVAEPARRTPGQIAE